MRGEADETRERRSCLMPLRYPSALEKRTGLRGRDADRNARFRSCAESSVEGFWETAMNIKRSGTQPSQKGPADYFTGTVRIDPLFETDEPGRGLGVSVTFEPGARTAWHVHPLGQTLIVTS